MDRHYTLGVFNYNRQKLCDLYDSWVELAGQAYDIVVTEEMNGYHTLNFSIPYMVNTSGSEYNRNFRWDYLKGDYLIRYTADDKIIWYVATKPVRKKSGKLIVGEVSCDGYESLLKTRNIYMDFDDTNGIGNMKYLMDQILMGTMWTYDEARSDILYENDGQTVKVRSMTSGNKQGSLGMIATVCNLFQARPVFDTDNQKVIIRAMRNRRQVLEGEIGRNLNAITVKEDSSNICTRVYVEGEYGDFGYVGIDDVIVDGEPWGLPFIINFDYYREVGMFTQEHEDALSEYLADIRQVKSDIREAGRTMTELEDELNTLIGQCKLVVYYKEDLETPRYIYGAITSEQAALHVDDDVVILKTNHTHAYEKWTGDPSIQLDGAYGVAKFVTKAAGKVGSAEVQIESKEGTIKEIDRKINNLTPGDSKIAEYNREKNELLAQINIIYVGNEDAAGLYQMMFEIVSSAGILYDYEQIKDEIDELNADQDEIEATFISAMGYMLRDGFWSNQNYITGQEDFLYADADDMAREMSRPAVEYSFDYLRVIEDFDIPTEDIEINAIFKVYDKELHVDANTFVKKISYGVDNKQNGKIEVSNQDITLTGNDLGSLLSRMSQLADLIEQKNALYERAKAISQSGSIYADRLNGQIDVVKTQIMSSVSNWHTDDNGNILFETADGAGAMMLSGAGFMLASSKDESGNWVWRMLGDSNGLTADEIVAGFISADRIEAGTIQASHLASDVGESLNLESNVSLNARIVSVAEEAAASMQMTEDEFLLMFQNTGVEERVNEAIDDVHDELENYQTEVSAYIRYDDSGTLTLGSGGDSFTTQITNQKLAFKEGDSEVAYISNQNMYITNANVTETLSIGKNDGNGRFDWTVTPTGLGLKWREPEFGNLNLTKHLISDKSGDEEQEFTFVITLSERLNATYGGVTFSNGVAIVTLTGGDTISIVGIPADITYVITEASVSGFHIEEKTGDVGIISTTESNAVFTNERDTGELEVSKVLESDDPEDEEQAFVFTVTLSEALNGTYGNMTFDNGVAIVSLLGGESSIANNIPVETTYTVVETEVAGFETTKTGDTGTITTTRSSAVFTNTRTT